MIEVMEALEDMLQTPDTREGRYYGIVRAKVTNVDDDLGRMKVRLGAQGDNEETDWVLPCWHPAMEGTFNVGDQLYVGFEDGDPNRPMVIGWHATSKSRNRPTEAVVLGTTFLGLFNHLVTQFNQLRSDMANHVHAAGTLLDSTANPVTGSTALKATTAVAAVKGKAADGSAVADKSTSEVVLSGKAKVR